MYRLSCFLTALLITAYAGAGDLDSTATEYVKLVLATGEHDASYVDAYYGPSQWRDEAREEAMTLPEISRRAQQLINDLPVAAREPIEQLRAGVQARRRRLVSRPHVAILGRLIQRMP